MNLELEILKKSGLDEAKGRKKVKIVIPFALKHTECHRGKAFEGYRTNALAKAKVLLRQRSEGDIPRNYGYDRTCFSPNHYKAKRRQYRH